jgi:hypothetical protein
LAECKFGSFKDWFNGYYAKLHGYPEQPHPCKYQCQFPEVDEKPDFAEARKLDYVKMSQEFDDFLKTQTKEDLEQWLEMDRKRMNETD